jgi:hypothetical protein
MFKTAVFTASTRFTFKATKGQLTRLDTNQSKGQHQTLLISGIPSSENAEPPLCVICDALNKRKIPWKHYLHKCKNIDLNLPETEIRSKYRAMLVTSNFNSLFNSV